MPIILDAHVFSFSIRRGTLCQRIYSNSSRDWPTSILELSPLFSLVCLIDIRQSTFEAKCSEHSETATEVITRDQISQNVE